MVKTLEQKLAGLVGDTVVSAGAVAYLGFFNTQHRQNLIKKWVGLCAQKHIPLSISYDFIKNTTDANQVCSSEHISGKT